VIRRRPTIAGITALAPDCREIAFPFAKASYNLDTVVPRRVRFNWGKIQMGIKLSEKAAGEVKRIMQEQNYGPETLLRVGVNGGGCSGFSYALGFDKTYDEKADAKSDQHGVTIVVDKKSALYLDGTTVDFYDGLEKRGFTFENPNAVKTCGCGSSFQA